MVELSIILPCFNNWQLTSKCLADLFHSTYSDYEIIVVDNASTDKTPILIKYLKQSENLNFCKGVNVSWREVKTPYLMLLNNDAFVDKFCLQEMMNVMYSDKNIAVVGALEFLPDGRPSKTSPYIYFRNPGLLDPLLLGESDERVKNNTHNNSVYVDIVGTACCIIRKSVSDEIGIFDERFIPNMWEQEDYFLRVKLAGYIIAMAKKAKMTHIVGATTAFNPSYYQEIIKINRQKFMDKWKEVASNYERRLASY